MFSGIVETQTTIQSVSESPAGLQVEIEKPSFFNDLSVGDSICVDGVCLTVEEFSDTSMLFTLAAETLQVTSWRVEDLLNRQVNLERSLRFGDRVHGHLVTGHVECRTTVAERLESDGSVIFWLHLPPQLKKWIWRKGCVGLNGVSLTVNEVKDGRFSVCLIPETLRRTNLAFLKDGDSLNIESDYLAKALVHSNEVER